MYSKLAYKLAFYTHMRAVDERLGLGDETSAYWLAKYYGFACCVEIVTGDYPSVIRRNRYEVEVHIGDYQTVITFD